MFALNDILDTWFGTDPADAMASNDPWRRLLGSTSNPTLVRGAGRGIDRTSRSGRGRRLRVHDLARSVLTADWIDVEETRKRALKWRC
jgi:hypothetical protein